MGHFNVVVLKNRQSGMVLDHYAGERIEAYDSNTSNPHHHWRRTVDHEGFISLFNVGTNKALAHYAGQHVQTRASPIDMNCLWEELDVGVAGFKALRNVATGMLLDHFREQSIQAYTSENHHMSQHWQLLAVPPVRRHNHHVQATDAAAIDLDQHDIVALANCKTSMVLDHYAGDRIEAFNSDVTDPHHQWYRIPLGDGWFAYKNVATGKVLEHYYGESVQAFTTITHLPSHQWREVRVGNDSALLLLNRETGKALDHCHELSIQACGSRAETDATAHWKLLYVHRGL